MATGVRCGYPARDETPAQAICHRISPGGNCRVCTLAPAGLRLAHTQPRYLPSESLQLALGDHTDPSAESRRPPE
jgi:hypothetical protein